MKNTMIAFLGGGAMLLGGYLLSGVPNEFLADLSELFMLFGGLALCVGAFRLFAIITQEEL